MLHLPEAEADLGTAAPSKMELFVISVNGFQSLTIITKCSILDVAAVLDPPLVFKAFFESNTINDIFWNVTWHWLIIFPS